MATGAPDRDRADGVFGVTILYVEDDNDLRQITVMLLTRLGYKVIEATDGATALNILDEEGTAAHILMADVGLPDMPGPKLFERVRDRWPSVKVLFTTGFPVTSARVKLGDEVILQKPYTLQSLRSAIDRALNYPAAIRALKKA